MLNLEADGLQQQKTHQVTLLSAVEQETEAIIGTGSPKLDNRGLEKCMV